MAKTRPRFQTESIIKTWPMVRLGEVCKFSRGLTYSKSDEVQVSSNAVLRSNNVDLESGHLILDELKYIRDSIEIPTSKRVSKGSILMCTANGSKQHLGKVALIDGEYDYAFGGFMGLLTPNADIDSRYLYWQLMSFEFKRLVTSLTDGANINNLKFADILPFTFPLPSLSEQKEIVARLERELAAVEKMKKGFEAFAKTAKAEFKAELKDVFEEISRGGAETRRLGDTFRFIDYRGMTPNKIATGVPLITAKNIRFGYMDYRERFYISEEDYAKRQTRGVARCGDILFTTEAPMGYVALADQKRFSTGQRIITFQWPNATEHNNRYFLYYFMSDVFQDQVRENASGATAQGIKSSRLVNLSVLIPECQKQSQVVARLDSAKARADKLEAKAREGVAVCETMRKAILKEAFEGSVREAGPYD